HPVDSTRPVQRDIKGCARARTRKTAEIRDRSPLRRPEWETLCPQTRTLGRFFGAVTVATVLTVKNLPFPVDLRRLSRYFLPIACASLKGDSMTLRVRALLAVLILVGGLLPARAAAQGSFFTS